jgi:hypothetical protein
LNIQAANVIEMVESAGPDFFEKSWHQLTLDADEEFAPYVSNNASRPVA